MERKEILKGLREGSYGFIANNYYKMDKETLKDILLEYIYLCNNEKEVIDSLEYDRWYDK